MYLFDEDLLKFFKKAHKHLKRDRKDSTKTGLIFVKENILRKKCIVEETDSSVTRPLVLYRQIFKEAGFEILKEF